MITDRDPDVPWVDQYQLLKCLHPWGMGQGAEDATQKTGWIENGILWLIGKK